MKLFIKNRANQKICVVVEQSEKQKLAFVMHGLGGNKEQGHIRAMVEAFLETGHSVVTFDTTNTYGESDGQYEDATITNYYNDLEDVIEWASHQPWYKEPFVLCGHSLGGISTAFYAENYTAKVKALAPISTVVSGRLSLEAHSSSPGLGNLDEWKQNGILVTKSYDGTKVKQLKWAHMEDRMKYDLLPNVSRLTMPVLLVVGDKDEPTPYAHQEILYKQIPGNKELHVIHGALHSFYEPHEQAELKTLVKSWASNL